MYPATYIYVLGYILLCNVSALNNAYLTLTLKIFLAIGFTPICCKILRIKNSGHACFG